MNVGKDLQRTAALFMEAEHPYRLSSFLNDRHELEMWIFYGSDQVGHRVWDLESFDIRYDAIFDWMRSTVDMHKRGSVVAVVGPWKKWGRWRCA